MSNHFINTMSLSPEEKKLDKLNKLFELVNEEYATPDDLISLSEAILGIITTERQRLDGVIASEKEEDKQEKADMLALLNEKEQALKQIITRLTYETEQAVAQVASKLSKTLDSEVKRLERKIPTKTDISGLEADIKALNDGLNSLPTELTMNNEAIRDGLELLEGDERLDKSAIKGLDDWEEIVALARTPKTIHGAGVKLLRYLSDVNIEGITNGQTLIWSTSLQRFEAGTAGASSPLTMKGDIYTYDTVDARFPVGTDGQVLSADSAETTGLKWVALAGGGDMVLAASQIVSGLKSFLDGTLGLRNVANTFTSFFTNTNTASRTYTLPDKDGTVAMLSDVSSGTTDYTTPFMFMGG